MKVKKWVRNIAFTLFMVGLLMLTGIADNNEISSLNTVLMYSTISIILSLPYALIFIHDLKEEKE